MGTRGPKPKPAKMHLVNGNPSKIPKRLLTGSDIIRTEIPAVPDHLSDLAKTEWNTISQALFEQGLIARIDRAALAVYCQAYGRWVLAETKLTALGADGLIDETPSGYKQISVWLQISNRAVETMHKFLGEFGMTPSARNRVTLNPQLDMFGDDKDDKTKKAKSYFS